MHKNWMRSVLSEWPWSKDKRLCRSVVPLQSLIPALLASWIARLCLLLKSHRVMLTFGLQELLASEEKNMVHKPELDRERNSVMHLSAAKADCEGIMTFFTFYSLLLVTIQIQRSSSDNSVARLEHTIIFILLGVPHFGPQVSFVSPPATRILLDSDNNSFAFRYPILSGEVIRIHVVFFTNSLQFYLFSFISPSALLLPFYRA